VEVEKREEGLRDLQEKTENREEEVLAEYSMLETIRDERDQYLDKLRDMEVHIERLTRERGKLTDRLERKSEEAIATETSKDLELSEVQAEKKRIEKENECLEAERGCLEEEKKTF
jgi:hypothetical protein